MASVTRPFRSLPLLLLLAACVDDPTAAVRQPEPDPAPRILGVYEFTLTGIGTSNMRASVSGVPGGPSKALGPAASGLVFEDLSSTYSVHGTRNEGGQRYFTITYRVRNSTGAPATNVTMVPVARSTTIPGTPFSSIELIDGTPANSAIAPSIVPAVELVVGENGTLRSLGTDVLQVFQESEVAAVAPPAGVTDIFPYGFVVKSLATPHSRTLAVAADANDFAGIVTFGFRYPLQASAGQDPYSVTFQAIALEDTETRMTESIEEGQDTSAVRRIRERAAALGATTVTVLSGSTAADAAVTDYPGQRQICSVRTAGTAGSPTTTMTAPGPYVLLRVYRPGESMNACGAYFRVGTAAPAAYNMPYSVTVRAMDLYGNVKTAQVDTVRLESLTGPAATIPAPAALTGGARTVTISYGAYGTSLLRAVGARNQGAALVTVAGITRVWSGDVSTDWATNFNWTNGMAPGSLDTVYIPASRPFYPLLAGNVDIGGVTVDDGATMDLGAFDLTSSGNVTTGATGGITSTGGRLILTGASGTVQGALPRLHVTGRYTLTGAVTVPARVTVDGGRLRTSTFRLQATAF